MNYQHWHGFSDTRFGYGSMLDGFLSSVPKGVKLNEKASVDVHMGVPFSCRGWLKGTHRVLFTMWETNELPSNFRRYIPMYDQVLVPNEFDAELFSKHHKNVGVVPLGVDTEWYKTIEVPRLDRFQFRAGGSLWGRKGLDVVVKAFNKLNLPDADLRIKAAPHARDVPDGPFGDNIYLDRQWMSEEEKREWFAQSDCFIAASRGEGFGLMPLQTIAMAVPTIISLTTGQVQFSHLATGTVPCTKRQSNSVGMWDEPDLNQLCEQMMHHYENRQQVRTQAVINSVEAQDFSWGKAATKLVAALPKGLLLTTTDFDELTVIQKVRAIRGVQADIGKNRIRQKAGDIFQVTDGEYQVLFDAGVIELA
jgi:glycosyltransferase involved in cell wall biosynthesis